MSEPTRSLPDADNRPTASWVGGVDAPLGTADYEPEVERYGPPPTVPGYAVGPVIAGGGMGVVYDATHTLTARRVALKFLHAGRHDDAREVVRFRAEAEAVAAVDHPHVVRVYDTGDVAGRPYLAMEYLPGGTLAKRLKAGRLPARAAAELVHKLAAGVQAAHDRQIVHRDLKPSNVLFDAAGEPRVADFGLAKRPGGDLTHTHAILGTPAYMAPEQAQGGSKFVGPAADVWALGVILYECLAGVRPFDGDGELSIIRAVVEQEPAALRSRSSGVPAELNLIVLTCLAKEPARYDTAADLHADLGRWMRGEPVSVKAAGPIERAVKWTRRNPTTAVAGGIATVALALFLFGVGAVVLLREARRERDVAGKATADEALARGEAVRERTAADGLRREAEQARDTIARQARELEMIEYGQQIQLALRGVADGDYPTAADLLARTRPTLRGWEYDHAYRHCHPELLCMTHPKGVTDLALSPDGSRAVTGCHDGIVRVWDLITGNLIHSLGGHFAGVKSVAYHPTASRFASVSGSGVLRTWDANTGATLCTQQLAPDGMLWFGAMCYSHDGSRIVVAAWKRVYVLDAQTLAVVANWATELRCIAAKFSADANRLIGVSENGVVRVWNAVDGRLLSQRGEESEGNDRFWAAAFNRTGELAIGGFLEVGIGNAESGAVATVARLSKIAADQRLPRRNRHHILDVTALGLSGDARHVAVANRGFLITMYRQKEAGAKEMTFVEQYLGHSAEVTSLAIDACGRVVSASDDGTLRVWSRSRDEAVTRVARVTPGHSRPDARVQFSADGRHLAAVDRETIEWYVADTGLSFATKPCPDPEAAAVGVSPDLKWLVSLRKDGSTRVWDTDTGRLRCVCDGLSYYLNDRSQPPAFAASGPYLVGLAANRKAVHVWHAETGRKVRSFSHEWINGNPNEYAVDLSKGVIATGIGQITLYDFDTGSVGGKILGVSEYESARCFTPDGQYLLLSDSKRHRAWNVATGRTVREFTADDKYSPDLHTWSPDGRRLLICDYDSCLRVRDSFTGTVVAMLEMPTNSFQNSCFSPDGRRMAISVGGSILIYQSGPPSTHVAPP